MCNEYGGGLTGHTDGGGVITGGVYREKVDSTEIPEKPSAPGGGSPKKAEPER